VYDGKTVAKAEENLLLRSQEFDNSVWGTANTIKTANTSTAPDGTTTADTIKENSLSGFHTIQQEGSATTGLTTLSVFAKLGSGTRFLTISLSNSLSNYGSATFDLSSGSNTQTQAAGTFSGASATIALVTEGFYRCTLTLTAVSASVVRIALNNTGTPTGENRGVGEDYTGDDTSSLILWGAQLEQRDAVTAYTPTTTQPITNYIPVLQSAANNVARFDHNPVTGESLGLLVEEQRTNLVLRSEEFDNASWSKTRSTVTANTIIAPDGTLTGDKLVENTDTNTHILLPNLGITLSTGVAYSYSIYAKAGERSICRLGNNDLQGVFFDLATGTVTSVGSGFTGSITSVGNGWYRLNAVQTSNSNATGRLVVSLVSTGTTTSYTGDGYSGIYIWGAQLEAGAFPTSYIPTVASQVTRSADAASMVGANFSSWFRQDEGTLYVDYFSGLSNNPQSPFIIDDATLNNRIGLFADVSTGGSISPAAVVAANNTSQASLSFGVAAASAPHKMALAYKVDNFAGVFDAGSAVTDTSGIIPVVNGAGIGSTRVLAAPNYINSHIRKISYYPKALTATQLQALTS
jgi:hypothetical protein